MIDQKLEITESPEAPSSYLSWGKKVWIGILLFLYIYNFPLFYWGIPVSAAKLVLLPAYVSLIIKPQQIVHILRQGEYIIYIFGSLILIAVFYFITDIIHAGNGDYVYIKNIFLYIVEVFFGAFFIINQLKSDQIKTLIKLLIAITFIQALIMESAVVNLTIKRFIFDVLDTDPNAKNFSQWRWNPLEYRGLALSADARLGLSVFHASICASIIWLFAKDTSKSVFSYFIYAALLIIISISGILGARTFFVTFACFLFLFVCSIVKNPSKLGSAIKYLITITVIAFSSSIILIAVITDEGSGEAIDNFTFWAFEMFNSYDATTGDRVIRTQSSEDLKENHLAKIPTDIMTWLIGDDNRSVIGGRHYIRTFTDSGYLLLIYYGGIIVSLLLYGFWTLISIVTNRLFHKSDKIGILIWGLLAFLLIGQIKTDFMPISLIIFKFLVLLMVFGVERNRISFPSNVSDTSTL